MSGLLLGCASWPNLHYFFHFCAASHVVIEQHDTYGKQSFRNRYELLSANGVLPLTIPVKRAGKGTKTRGVMIDYSTPWQTQHWRALTSAYRKSPFFEYFEHDVLLFFTERTDLLLEYNLQHLHLINKLLQLNKKIELSPVFEKTPAGTIDLRETIHPKRPAAADEAASLFLNKKYYQTFGDRFGFIPNLSILDLLFNLGLGAKRHLVEGE